LVKNNNIIEKPLRISKSPWLVEGFRLRLSRSSDEEADAESEE
jgi:hypothetical protein